MLVFILIFLGFFGYATTDTAVDRAVSPNDIILTQPDDAAAYVETHLGQPLPPGIRVNGVFEGGFQDTYVQIKMTVPVEAIPDLYAALNVDPTSMYAVPPNPFLSDQTWWDIHTHDQVWQANANFGSFYVALISMVPDPTDSAKVLIYLGANNI